MKCVRYAGLVGASVLALGLVAFAQDSSAPQDKSRTGTSNRTAGMAAKSADSTFAMKAAQGGMAEVKLGNLAKEKAADPDVKKFGEQMVADHSKAGDELKQIAQTKGINLPADIDAKNQALYDRLAKLSGAEFDREYMKHMVSDHRTDVAEFKREADRGGDAELKAFASKTLPTLQSHLQMAESTDAKVKGGTKK